MRLKDISILAVAVAVMLAVVALAPVAYGDDKKDCKREQDCALNAFQGGEIRPLTEVLAVAKEKLPGEVIKVELEREDGVWVYEVKVLTTSGRRREIEINAKTLAVIKID